MGGTWVPITLAAALAQTVRNAAQRHLTGGLGALGATLVRFLYGLPFAVIWLAIVVAATGNPVPGPNLGFVAWTVTGALAQITATALLLRVMAERNFALGVAYTKTEVVQVAIFGAVLLAEPVSLPAAAAIVVATAGVMLVSFPPGERTLRAFLVGWTSRTAMLGLASGGFFAISAVGYRGGALSLETPSVVLAAAVTLVWAQAMQSLALGGWLQVRAPEVIRAVLRAWRVSLLAGLMGALASMGWFTAMAMEPVAHVRTLGLVELLFSYAISLKVFREKLGRMEIAGVVLLVIGLVGILNFR